MSASTKIGSFHWHPTSDGYYATFKGQRVEVRAHAGGYELFLAPMTMFGVYATAVAAMEAATVRVAGYLEEIARDLRAGGWT